MGHQVTILCGSGNFRDSMPLFSLYKRYDYAGIQVVRLRSRYSHFMSFAARMAAFVHFFGLALVLSFTFTKPDVVYASSTPLSVGALGIWFKKRFNARLFFETVDLWPDVPIEMGFIRGKRIKKMLYKLEDRLYREAEKVVCLSEGMKEKILAKGVEEGKILVAHNGSNPTVFYPSQEKAKLKHAFGFHEQDFVVLYAGTVGFANQLEFFLDVASWFQSNQNDQVKFLLIGNGNRAEQVKQYQHSLQLKNTIWLEMVPKEKVVKYFQMADVGMVVFAPFPVLETNSANKFFDYLACGLPVLINYAGWQKEYLDEYGCGFSEPSVQGMAERIDALAASPAVCLLLGEKARELACAKFDRKQIAKRLEQEFSDT